MPRRVAPWMVEPNLRAKERAEAEKLAKKARGSRVFAVLPWRPDARYDGADVIRWFRSRGSAEKFGLGLRGGRGSVVREWNQIANPDAEAKKKTSAELEREIAEAIAKYGY